MTVDKFGRHISQPKQSHQDQEDFVVTSTSFERNITNGLYDNIILTFESTTFQENSKKYLISNIKTCHVFFYESAMIEFATDYSSDIVTVINEKEFTLTELVNVQLHQVKEDIVNELHKPARINFKRRRTIKVLNDLLQADLIDLISYSKKNNGYKYVLIVINCFSKFVWTEPPINKSAQEVANAMNKILQRSKKIPKKNLQTDMGKEFYNTNFNKLMKKYKITHYSVYSAKKASIVERSIRTIKNMIK
ncbi:hypothetical protein NQ315_016700 [Exocentrus adspersus]|uniref:Integrase catalytic domain-containing protein n=1 Tax=Exocentrus adspersus TaxID=1586481 RepID=A0AAV8VEW2_9CUCU|nr:hypothetical protein NQ315_016700 [Exocentrus adspersus]